MADLIDRQAAIEVIDAVFPADSMKAEYAQGIACAAALAKTYVEQLPSAQPEIIRCKDCKWHGYKECFHKLGLIAAFDDNYCSYAEREEK